MSYAGQLSEENKGASETHFSISSHRISESKQISFALKQILKQWSPRIVACDMKTFCRGMCKHLKAFYH